MVLRVGRKLLSKATQVPIRRSGTCKLIVPSERWTTSSKAGTVSLTAGVISDFFTFTLRLSLAFPAFSLGQAWICLFTLSLWTRRVSFLNPFIFWSLVPSWLWLFRSSGFFLVSFGAGSPPLSVLCECFSFFETLSPTLRSSSEDARALVNATEYL